MNTFEIVRLIGDAPIELLSAIETSLLTRMAFLAHRGGKNINPGVDELIRQTKFSRRTIVGSLNDLVKKSILIVSSQRKRNRGDWEKSCYELNIKLLQEKRVSEKDYYDSLEDKIKLKKLKKSNLSSAGDAHLRCAGGAHLKYENKNLDVQEVHISSAGGALLVVQEMHIAPYTPHISPVPPSNVELVPNSTCLSAQKEHAKVLKKKKSRSVEILEVFGHWQKVLNHPGSMLDKKRRQYIFDALSLGYSVVDLKKAIDGNKKSAWHQGGNPGGVLYDSIGLIFRNSDKIETFISIFDTEGAVKNKNVATGFNLSFPERNKSRVNAMAELEAEMFPEYADTFVPDNQEGVLLTLREEREINEPE